MSALGDEIEKAGKALAITVAREATATSTLREYNERQSLRDPARLAWPATLTTELALKTASPQELKEHYQISDEDWLALPGNPVFMAELASQVDKVKQDGMGFRMKAQLQAEPLLETQWKLIHGPASEVPAAVKARMIETVFRIAGYDNKDAAGASSGSTLAIQINLGG